MQPNAPHPRPATPNTAVPPATYGRGRTVRLAGHDYAADRPIHLTLCARSGRPFDDGQIAAMVCASVQKSAEMSGYLLFAYCLMPDHLHVLVSPGDSRKPVAQFLHRLKSFTTHECRRMRGTERLWQTTAHDRVLRDSDDVMTVATYVANNPVRAGLAQGWSDWPYSRVFYVG